MLSIGDVSRGFPIIFMVTSSVVVPEKLVSRFECIGHLLVTI